MRDEPALPMQPVPSLPQTLAAARAAMNPFLKGFAVTRGDLVLALFKLAAGKAHQRLVERTQPDAPNWASEGLLRYYLGVRGGLPYHSAWPVVLDDDPQRTTAAARAAALVGAALELRAKMASGELPRDTDGATPLEMSQYRHVFSTNRIPRVGCDDLVTADPSTHLAVLSKGHAWRVELGHGSLERAFSEIAAQGTPTAPPMPGELTASPRDAWAAAREGLLSNPKDRDSIAMIETALLVVCLDDDGPQTLDDTARLVRDGNPANRWYDRCVQLIVFANGKAGLWVEHSAMDGDPTARFCAAMVSSAAARPDEPGEAAAFTRAEWSPVDLAPARASITAALAARETRTERFPQLAPLSRMHLGAVMQLAVQLACRLELSEVIAVVEPVQTRRFRGGRFDGFMAVTAESKAFVEAAATSPDSPALAELARAAVRAHFAQLVRSKKGNGWHSHFNGLSAMDFPMDRVKGALGENKKRALLSKLHAGLAMIVKWEMNAGSVPALKGVSSMGNVGIAPQMMALGYMPHKDAIAIDLRADGKYRGHVQGLLTKLVASALRIDALLKTEGTAKP